MAHRLDPLNNQFDSKPSVFNELLIGYSTRIYITAEPSSSANFLNPARITETRNVTTEMMDGAGFENEFVGIENG